MLKLHHKKYVGCAGTRRAHSVIMRKLNRIAKKGDNYGNEIQIVQSNGWLIKRYTSEKEVKSLVLGEKIAGVVYKDRIEIINF